MRGMAAKDKRVAILEEIAGLKLASGIDKTLRERGIHLTDIPELAEKALRDPCLVTNPRRFNKRDIEVIYAEAL